MTKGNNRCMMVLIAILVAWLGNAGSKAWGATASSQVPVPVPYYAPPRHMDLCGEPVPLQKEQVWERFDREFTIAVYNRAQVYLWLKRMERYFPWLERQLKIYHLPQDLKYVTVAESDLLHNVCSPAGAVGPWQFISTTGRHYGLEQTFNIDERRNFQMATQSAFRYLRNLHDQFHDWSLALAAYNCGAKRVRDQISLQHVDNYYALKLPLETERYVFRILAIKAILDHPERYGYHLPKGAGYPPLREDPVMVKVPYPLPIEVVAQAAGMTYREFKVFNPEFISDTLPAGTYTLRIKDGKANAFEANLKATEPKYAPPPRPRLEIVHHRVRRGQTLSGIARDYGVSMRDIRRWNHLHRDTIRIGQVLVIRGHDHAARGGSVERRRRAESSRTHSHEASHSSSAILSHRVRRGETLSGIASHYGVSTGDIRHWNHLHGNTIRIGQVLEIKGTASAGEHHRAEAQVQHSASHTRSKIIRHRVRRGETLSGIASHYGVSTGDIRHWNHLHGNTIRIGQVLRIEK